MVPLYDNPKALFPVVSSFASVLFKPHDLTPILVDISGVSSSGKAGVQKVCTSVWGKPSEYIRSMLTTKIAIERMAAFLNTLSLIVDDTNPAHNPKALQQMIYMFCNDTDKIRGSLEVVECRVSDNQCSLRLVKTTSLNIRTHKEVLHGLFQRPTLNSLIKKPIISLH